MTSSSHPADSVLDYQQFYLVGIKGVAMASLAQCLVEAGKTVRGCDVADHFVTQPLLDEIGVKLDVGFDQPLPTTTECVIYTAAHQGRFNKVVQAAQAASLPTWSQAEAIASLFNQQQGVAVCGVGGKSTTSAMIAWIMEKTGQPCSYSVGVGSIPGLTRTGRWQPNSRYFVAEADEYVTDPSAPSRGEEITPRFSFLKPALTVCTNLKFDHPDVYRDFAHTLTTFKTFFEQLKPNGILVTSHQVKTELQVDRTDLTWKTWGDSSEDWLQYLPDSFVSSQGKSSLSFQINENGQPTAPHTLTLPLPGLYNLMNGLAAIAATMIMGVRPEAAIAALAEFHSTKRRAEFIGDKQGVKYYDDYAHHPSEIAQVIKAFRDWFPDRKLVVAFQAHTFSRTKALFTEFSQAFGQADEVAMIDIFASAREPFDSSITSEMLCQAIMTATPQIQAHNYRTLPELAEHLKTTLETGDVCLSVGAGDIYLIHDLL
jgi:UDP-N-acetylmuramate--alanine ligase